MKRPVRVLLAVTLLGFPVGSAEAAHRIALQGNGKLAIVNRDGSIDWQMKWGGIHDIHVLANGHYVIGNCHAGPRNPLVIEIDPKTKKVVWTLDAGPLQRLRQLGPQLATTRRRRPRDPLIRFVTSRRSVVQWRDRITRNLVCETDDDPDDPAADSARHREQRRVPRTIAVVSRVS